MSLKHWPQGTKVVILFSEELSSSPREAVATAGDKVKLKRDYELRQHSLHLSLCRTFVFSGTAEEKKMGHFPFFPCQFRLEMKCVISLKQEKNHSDVKKNFQKKKKKKNCQNRRKLKSKIDEVKMTKINGKCKMRLFSGDFQTV